MLFYRTITYVLVLVAASISDSVSFDYWSDSLIWENFSSNHICLLRQSVSGQIVAADGNKPNDLGCLANF